MRRLMILIGIFAALGVGMVARAQDTTDAPIILWLNGDLWAYRAGAAELEQLTDFGTVENPVISPDATRIAFTAFSPLTKDAIAQSGGFGGGVAPNDVWLLTIASGRLTKITEQRADAAFSPETGFVNARARSKPAWSPNGTGLVWGEIRYPTDLLTIVRYDFHTGERLMIVEQLPEQHGVPVPLEVSWGKHGLLVWSITWDSEQSREAHQALVYTTAGVLENSLTLYTPGDVFPVAVDWIAYRGDEYIGVLDNNQFKWWLFDSSTGSRLEGSYPVEWHSPLNAERSLRVTGPYNRDRSYEYKWIISEPSDDFDNGFAFVATWNRLALLSLSPDGRQVAYAPRLGGHNTLLTMEGINYLLEVPHTFPNTQPQDYLQGVLWGPMARRVLLHPVYATEPPNYEAGPNDCAGSEVFRLKVGAQARVMPGSPNNIRDVPGRDAAKIGQIPAGAIFEVIGGPDCVDGITWWRVTYAGITGWTAEGADGEYFLEPLS